MRFPDPEPTAARRRFVLRRGILGWGLSTALLFSIAFSWWMDAPFLGVLVVSLPVFSAGGWFWGTVLWKHRRATASR